MNRLPLSTRESRPTRWGLLCGALLVLATLLAYLPAMHCGYIWDDDVYVTGNPLLSAPDGLWRIWFSFDSPSQYFPLVYTTLRIEDGLWGLAPFGYHCVNIVLHAANALLLWRLLKRLEIPGAWFAAAIFALHPVQVESVAWVTELKNVQMGFFFLLALLAWTEFAKQKTPRAWWFYACSLVFYALSLFSKTTACTLPAALLLIEWLREGRIGWRKVAQIVPYVALGIGMGLLTVWWERFHQGTQGAAFTMSLSQRLLIAARGVWFYLAKLFWPAKLTFSYPRWTISTANPLAWLWPLALCGLGSAALLARRVAGRGPSVALAFFVATLGPVLGLLMLYTFRYSFVADHYQYLACIGPIALVCAGVVKFADRYPQLRVAAGTAGGMVLLTLGALTWSQAHIYRSNESIWRDTLAKNPGSLMAHFNLANELMRDGSYQESLTHYDRAVEIDPTFFEARCNRADLLAHLGELPAAAADYKQALEIEPNDAAVQIGCANVLATEGDFVGALPHYQQVARLVPNSAQPHMLLGSCYASLSNYDDAIREYRETVRLAPQSPEALTRLAWLLAQCNDPRLRNGAEALSLAQRACDLTNHKNGVPLNALAAAYAANGRIAAALNASILAINAAINAGDKTAAADYQKQMALYERQDGRQ